MAGMRPTECDLLVEVFRDINRHEGLTILLIEHVRRAVMTLARQIVVLHHGEVIARGAPGQVVHDAAVLECYLREETQVRCCPSDTWTFTTATYLRCRNSAVMFGKARSATSSDAT